MSTPSINTRTNNTYYQEHSHRTRERKAPGYYQNLADGVANTAQSSLERSKRESNTKKITKKTEVITKKSKTQVTSERITKEKTIKTTPRSMTTRVVREERNKTVSNSPKKQSVTKSKIRVTEMDKVSKSSRQTTITNVTTRTIERQFRSNSPRITKKVTIEKQSSFEIKLKKAEVDRLKIEHPLACYEVIDFDDLNKKETYNFPALKPVLISQFSESDVFTAFTVACSDKVETNTKNTPKPVLALQFSESEIIIASEFEDDIFQEMINATIHHKMSKDNSQIKPPSKKRKRKETKNAAQPAKKQRKTVADIKKAAQPAKQQRQSITEIKKELIKLEQSWEQTYKKFEISPDQSVKQLKDYANTLQKIKGTGIEKKYLQESFSQSALLDNINSLTYMVNPCPFSKEIFNAEKTLLERMYAISINIFKTAKTEEKTSICSRAENLSKKITKLLEELSKDHALYYKEEKTLV